ncbi:cystinosin-like isoform X1 [Haliotis rubra]|uniref:cystinosin-like isoform X1 n=1 Tax=Haliotis rubra TaxID=36100 RepID=UPI001EE5086C|nr:cystinosin-like isoform X1 [Haliotis rubra]
MFHEKHVYLQVIFLFVDWVDHCGLRNVTVTLTPKTITLEGGHSSNASLCLSQSLSKTAILLFTYDTGKGVFFSDDREVVAPLHNLTLRRGTPLCRHVHISGVNPGHVFVGVNSTSPEFEDLSSLYIRVDVIKSSALNIVSVVIGWIYFVAWTLAGYPQVYTNWRRKSVVGLNLDFISYNMTSFIAYALYNCGLFWIPSIQAEYFVIHPRGINPVQLNDVFFALHAFVLSLFIVIQCLIYDRGSQKISKVCHAIQGLIYLFLVITLFVAVAGKITWLTYLYYFSYIKLGITLIKYSPQAYMIYKTKSIEGFSIVAVACDFTGGLFSVLQMFLLSINSDDWGSIIGDPTKFGLGLFSMMFDVVFLVQNCMYKKVVVDEERTPILINEEKT